MFRVVVLALITAVGCGGDGGGGSRPQAGGEARGLILQVGFDQPLRSGGPVTWRLQVTNGGPDRVTLVFPSGRDGEVILRRDGQEAYRWSGTRYFTQAMRQIPLEPGERRTFPLEETSLAVAPGRYELVAELDSEPAPPPARQTVEVQGA